MKLTAGYNTVLDYSAEVIELDERDAFYLWDSYQNFSLTGFEIRLKRQSLKYMVNYFLPSGLFVVASWVICDFHIKVKFGEIYRRFHKYNQNRLIWDQWLISPTF